MKTLPSFHQIGPTFRLWRLLCVLCSGFPLLAGKCVRADALSDALDSPLAWTQTGSVAILSNMPNVTDRAIGQNCVHLQRTGTLSTTLPGPCEVLIRYRTTTTSLVVRAGTYRLSWPTIRPDRWQTMGFRLTNIVAGDTLTITANGCLIDRTQIIHRPSNAGDISLTDALDSSFGAFTGSGHQGVWGGVTGLGHDGVDAASFPITTGGVQDYALTLPLATGQGGTPASIQGSFWWYRSDPNAYLVFRADGTSVATLTATHEWQRVFLHMDEAPRSLVWQKAVTNAFSMGPLHLVDEASLSYQPPLSFSSGLETNNTPEDNTHFPGGWSALGNAEARAVTSTEVPGTIFHGGDAVQVAYSDEANSEGGARQQECRLTAHRGKGTRLSFWAKATAEGQPKLELEMGAGVVTALNVSTQWTQIRTYLPISAAKLALTVRVEAGGKLWLDNFSMDDVLSTDELLETPGYEWTLSSSTPTTAEWTSHVENVPNEETPFFAASFRDCLKPGNLPGNAVASLETTVTGPAQLVLAMEEVGGTAFECEIDTIRREAEAIRCGSCLQWTLGPGTHTLKLRYRNLSAEPLARASVRGGIYCMAVVKEEDVETLQDRLARTAGELIFRTGGTDLPLLQHYLWEGQLDPEWDGIILPKPTAAGGSCWVEMDLPLISAPEAALRAPFTSLDAGTATLGGLLSINGKLAAHATKDDTVIYLPNSTYTVRFHGNGQTCLLRRVTYSQEPLRIPAFNARNSPQIQWTEHPLPEPQYSRTWTPSTVVLLGPPFLLKGEPGEPPAYDRQETLATALTGGDHASGYFMVDAPCMLEFDFAAYYDAQEFSLQIDNAAPLYPFDGIASSFTNDVSALVWHRHGLLVTGTGRKKVTFRNTENDSGQAYQFLKDISVRQIADYLPWADLHQLTGEDAVFHADADKDGFTNLAEYAFGTSPSLGGINIPFTFAPKFDSQSGKIAFRFPSLPYAAGEIRYRCESSTDLVTWQTIATVRANGPGQAGPQVDWTPPSGARVYARVTVLGE